MTYAELTQFTHDQLAEYTHYQLSLTYLLKYITDRSKEDVERVKYLNRQYLTGQITDSEKTEWESDLKGTLNISDLNRVEGNVQILAGLLAVVAETKSWALGDIPTVDDYERILRNVTKIRDGWLTYNDTPETPSQPLNAFEKWNVIERILRDIHNIWERTKMSFYYCGDDEVFAGEDVGVI